MSPLVWFVDTGFRIALVNRDDVFHERARALNARLRGSFVTTEAILLELGDAFAQLRWRSLGRELLKRIRTEPLYDVVPITTALLDRSMDLYDRRPDKEWGLTDCLSFIVMEDRGITEALAADQHFVQAGFRALLREP
jgi:uncharacterized protein